MAKPIRGKAKQPWQDIAREVQHYRDASIDRIQPPLLKLSSNLPANTHGIPKEVLSHEEIQITQTPPENLLSRLAAGELTAASVTRAFLRRAGLAQKLVSHASLGLCLPRQQHLDQLRNRTSPRAGLSPGSVFR